MANRRRNPLSASAVVGDCSRQTIVTTAALNTIVAIGGMPTVYTVVTSVWMTRAPTRVPTSEYRPPASEVPPMTTARIASSSMKSPVLLASAAAVFAVRMSPAIAAQNAEKVYDDEEQSPRTARRPGDWPRG